ncbi:MAG: retropepsin-like aspartic protease [Candidatus Omnitrophota bacterium]
MHIDERGREGFKSKPKVKCLNSWFNRTNSRDAVRKNHIPIAIFSGTIISLSACAVLNLGKETIGTVGRVVGSTAKVTETAGKVAVATLGAAADVAATVINLPRAKGVVKLKKKGNNLFVDVLFNRKVKAKMLLDTGCTDTQISRGLAKRLGINYSSGDKVFCTLAGGHVVSGRAIIIKEAGIGKVKVYNLKAIVLDNDKEGESQGLLGMSFLNNFIFKIDGEKGELVLERQKG